VTTDLAIATAWYVVTVVVFTLLGRPAVAKRTHTWRQGQTPKIRRLLLPGNLDDLETWQRQQRIMTRVGTGLITVVYALIVLKTLSKSS
jgi:hypothetical protein